MFYPILPEFISYFMGAKERWRVDQKIILKKTCIFV